MTDSWGTWRCRTASPGMHPCTLPVPTWDEQRVARGQLGAERALARLHGKRAAAAAAPRRARRGERGQVLRRGRRHSQHLLPRHLSRGS